MYLCNIIRLYAIIFFLSCLLCSSFVTSIYPVCGWTLVLQQLKLHFCSNFVFYIAAVLVGFRVLQSGIPQERHTKKKAEFKMDNVNGYEYRRRDGHGQDE